MTEEITLSDEQEKILRIVRTKESDHDFKCTKEQYEQMCELIAMGFMDPNFSHSNGMPYFNPYLTYRGHKYLTR